MGIMGILPRRPRPTPYTTGDTVGNRAYQGASSGGRSSSGGYQEVESPWGKRLEDTYNESKKDPYGGNWREAVAKAMALGNRDYEGDLKRFAAENVANQQRAADNQLGSYGMREMALRGDVQADRVKQRTDADTRAVIESQGIKTNALDTMRSVLAGASGAELARIASMISAASAGASDYNQFQSMMIALQEKMGAEKERRLRERDTGGGNYR